MDQQGISIEVAVTTAEEALQQLQPVLAHLLAIQTAQRLYKPLPAPHPLLEETVQTIEQYERLKANGTHSLSAAIEEYIDFADRLQKLQISGTEHCLTALPEFEENVYKLTTRLYATAKKRSNSEWSHQLGGQLLALQMHRRQNKSWLAATELVELTSTFIPVITEAHEALTQLSAAQRKQRRRLQNAYQQAGVKQQRLGDEIEAALTALNYLRVQSSEPTTDSEEALTEAQTLLLKIDASMQRLLPLSELRRQSEDEFKAEIATVNSLYSEASRLCRGVVTRQAGLAHSIERIAGYLKWIRCDLDKLTKLGPRTLEATRLEVAKLDSRLHRFEEFATREPGVPWPEPKAACTALGAMQKLVWQIDATTADKTATIENYRKNRNLAPIDSVLQSLPT